LTGALSGTFIEAICEWYGSFVVWQLDAAEAFRTSIGSFVSRAEVQSSTIV
jgi:hypothetical protein